MNSTLNEVTEMLRCAISDRFFGHIELVFVNGEITTVRREQTLKPGNLLDPKRTNPNGDGSQK